MEPLEQVGVSKLSGHLAGGGRFGTIGGEYIGLINLAIGSGPFSLAALLARQSKDCPVNEVFREAGAQNSAPPLEASLKVSSATARGSRSFRVW